MVWGAVWWTGKTDLYFVNTGQSIDAVKYVEILESTLLPAVGSMSRRLLQQDLATPHTATLTKDWLLAHNIAWIKDYPPNAGDLSVVDHVWSWMAKRVRDKKPRTRAALTQAIKDAWSELTQEHIRTSSNTSTKRWENAETTEDFL